MDQSIAPSPDFQSILCADHMFCLYISANRYGDFRRRIALFLSFPIQRTPFSRCFGKQKRLMWKTWTGSRFIGNKIYDNIELWHWCDGIKWQEPNLLHSVSEKRIKHTFFVCGFPSEYYMNDRILWRNIVSRFGPYLKSYSISLIIKV